MYIDGSVYPDLDEPPRSLDTPEDRADYVQRICAAWDFGIQPEQATVDLLAGWQEVFDRFPLYVSPSYHAFRACFGWPSVAVPPGLLAPTPRYVQSTSLKAVGPIPAKT